MGEIVQLYVYDLSQGMARALSPQLLGMQLDGVWHTGVVVYGKEYFFGGGTGGMGNMTGISGPIGNPSISGVKYTAPGTTLLGQPGQVIPLGVTEVPEEVFNDFLVELASSTFKASDYNLFEHNCNHFSNEVSQFLTGNGIPENILNLPQQVLNSPFGGMIRQMFGGVNVL